MVQYGRIAGKKEFFYSIIGVDNFEKLVSHKVCRFIK